jgi:geranylgeranyl diphosphate synthase type I
MLAAVEIELRRCLEALPPPYSDMDRMVRHHFGWLDSDPEPTGKRLRPRLCLLCADDVGGDWRAALPAAAAVELIHNFSLIHDDIQDASETRRGRPTVWTRWGVPQAINTGDFIFVAAHLACRRLLESGANADLAATAQHLLDQAALGLTRGQHLDLAFESRDDVQADEYLEMISGKTAGLLAASACLGALAGGGSGEAQQAYYRFGWNLGMAFQLLDDLLGIWGEPEQTGKSAADDLRRRKKTYPVLLGLAESAEFARLWRSGAAGAPRVSSLQQALEATPAQEETRRQAEDYTRAAMEALAAAPRRREGSGALESLAEGLLQRDR